MTAEELAWACGLFEGEGCVTHKRYGQRTARMLSLGMKDEDVVQRFARVVGCGKVRRRFAESDRAPMFYWHARRWLEIEPLMRAMLPYMGERRRAAMEALLANPVKRPHEVCPKCDGR